MFEGENEEALRQAPLRQHRAAPLPIPTFVSTAVNVRNPPVPAHQTHRYRAIAFPIRSSFSTGCASQYLCNALTWL